MERQDTRHSNEGILHLNATRYAVEQVRETVWRVGFHVGYVNVGREGGGIRLGKESLDGGRGEESVTLEFGGERGGEDEEEKEVRGSPSPPPNDGHTDTSLTLAPNPTS